MLFSICALHSCVNFSPFFPETCNILQINKSEGSSRHFYKCSCPCIVYVHFPTCECTWKWMHTQNHIVQNTWYRYRVPRKWIGVRVRTRSMGTFADTANVDYGLSFTDQGKQTEVCRFRLQQTNRNCCFPYIHIYSICKYVYRCVCVRIYIYIDIDRHIDIYVDIHIS